MEKKDSVTFTFTVTPDAITVRREGSKFSLPLPAEYVALVGKIMVEFSMLSMMAPEGNDTLTADEFNKMMGDDNIIEN